MFPKIQFVIHCGKTLFLKIYLSTVNSGNLYCRQLEYYDTGKSWVAVANILKMWGCTIFYDQISLFHLYQQNTDEKGNTS